MNHEGPWVHPEESSVLMSSETSRPSAPEAVPGPEVGFCRMRGINPETACSARFRLVREAYDGGTGLGLAELPARDEGATDRFQNIG